MHKHEEGFTLIELIISIALIGILAVVFLPIFGNAIKWISNSGRDSRSHYTAASNIENNMNDPSATEGGTVTSPDNIQLAFPSGTYIAAGRKIQVTYPYAGNTREFTTFTTY